MHILLLILKIIGILFLILLLIFVFLIFAVLFAPLRYRAEGELLDEKKADISASWLLFVLRVACSVRSKEVTVTVRLLGFPVFSYPKQDRSPKRQRKKNKAETPQESTLPEVRPDTAYDEEIKYLTKEKTKKAASDPSKSTKNRKKRSPKRILTKIWQKLKQTGKNLAHIKEMIYDESNRSAFAHGGREFRYLLRHFGPRKLKADLMFGTDNPARTGQILGAICIFPVIYRNEMQIVPDFEADSFYIKGTFAVKGHIRLIHALCSGIRIWRDKNIRKLIGNIRK